MLVAVPPDVVTVITPVAPLATVALMLVVLTTVMLLAVVLPKATAVTPVKLLPVIVTTVPVPPTVGVNEVMLGARLKVKEPILVAIPPGVVTVSVPLAPLPTVMLIVAAVVTVKEAAAVPPTTTAVAPVKLAPVMVTTVPAVPLVGVNEVIIGAG